VIPPKPPVVSSRIAERSSSSRVRCAAPNPGAPWTPAGRSAESTVATGGSGGITTSGPITQPHHDLLAIRRPFLAQWGTAPGRTPSPCDISSVSRPARSPEFNLRGQHPTVPANGCLVPLARGPNRSRIRLRTSWLRFAWLLPRFSKVQGDLFLLLTSPYHGCPQFR